MRCFAVTDRGVALLIFLAFAIAFTVALAPACNPQATQQDPQWPPVVEFESASLSGSLAMSTPAGPVTVELGSGIVSGDGELELVSADLSGDVVFSINGARQVVRIASPGARGADGWAQCVDVRVSTEIIKGLSVEIVARPPGLKESCGPAMLDVQTPLGRWVVGGPDASPTTALEE